MKKISHLPSKNEFYTKMDEVMGELKTSREEQTVQSHESPLGKSLTIGTLSRADPAETDFLM